MRKYELCKTPHLDDNIEVPCGLCRKSVNLSEEHYVQTDTYRVAMHVDCALAAALDTENNV